MYRSIDEAWTVFAAYAQLEPRLRALWDLCRRAAPPVRELELDEAENPPDPFCDEGGAPDDGWCADQYFDQQVKRRLGELVGAGRRTGPVELQLQTAYYEVHDALREWALARPCACCARVSRRRAVA